MEVAVTLKNDKATDAGSRWLKNLTSNIKDIDMNNNNLKTEDNQEAKEEISLEKNAFKIKSKGKSKLKFTPSIKKELKDVIGCQYVDILSAYVCPLGSKTEVSNLLEKNKINADLVEFHNPLPKKSKKINGMETRLHILEKEVHKEDMELLVEAHKMKDEEGRHKSIQDFKDPPKEPGKDEKSGDLRYRIELDLHERFKANDEKRKEAEELRRYVEQHEKEKTENEKVLERLNKNESGDAEIFVELFEKKYLFDPTEGKNGAFYLWDGCQWTLDIHKERYKDFEKVSDTYLIATSDESIDESVSKELFKRSQQLRTSRRRSNVLETVSAYLSFKHSWDYCPNKLPCSNGIINLKTGDLETAQRENYIKKVCPTSYEKNANCPKFLKFLDDITLGDKELSSFIGRVIGYALLGVPKEEKIFYFYGNGRNGKGTLMHVIQHVLGALSKTFPSEMLLSQRNPPSSSSPNPELANLEGVRMAVFSEINEGRKIDSAKVKNLSGRDIIPCRRLYSNVDLQITPTHTMILQTNYKPKAPSEDKALWSRNILIPFKARFVKEPKDGENEREIKESLKDELLEEAKGILKWMVDGCLEYQEIGLKVPQSVIDQTEGYRKENDGIGCFLEEMCFQDPAVSTQKSKMEAAIKNYCKANEMKEPTRNEISDYLKIRFKEGRKSQGSYWKGIKIED
ncbi:phage/plasmid primase (plasmid) [Waddlia chondrophila WSU 86-1044]|uniref:Phage/plasmid primase n=2 Tax=Waddlia chondrophila TaxID=71667 RepID=D6YX18_WADCW|nr:phage/plasmid primase [Waddlia chondrophila WSU 86-1044]